MVAKIMVGKSIRGALNYNERKVLEQKATLLDADGFLLSLEQLSFQDKLFVFSNRTELNDRARSNCVHISINFDKMDSLDKSGLLSLTDKYLERIGFIDQPFLVYEHHDAAHKHIHVVTTNIRSDGTQIPMYNLGRDKSMKACRELEMEYQLVNATTKKQDKSENLKPILEKVVYGKSETKSAVTNTVRAVVRDYTFTSLAEFNAVLKGFNVEAYRGETGTRMYEKGGLTYHVLDRKGKRIGVPIKSSSIYTKPTLKCLESVFLANKNKKQFHKNRLQHTIDMVLQSPVKDRFAFRLALKRENIDVLYRENESMVYGITFIDHNTKCVFNGSDLGKAYTAKSLLRRITESGAIEIQRQENEREKLQDLVNSFDYQLSPEQNLSRLYSQGIQLETTKNKYGYDKYYLSFQEGDSSVKASDLSTRPTLKNLEKVFQQKKDYSGHYYRKIRGTIDKAIGSNVPNLKELQTELKKEQIEVVIYQNKQMVYGIAFIDHTSKVVVNGSELGRSYSAKRIQDQLGIKGLLERKQNMLNQEKLSAFAKGIPTLGNAENALSYIYSNGLKLEASKGKYQNFDYRLSFQDQKSYSSIGLYGKMRAHFEDRNITPELCAHLNNHVYDNGINLIQDYIHGLFAQQSETLFGHITQDKKKPKRRINW